MTSPHSVNVPSIRFKGFTDVWEECKLEEICNYYASSLSAKHINNEGIYDLYDANTIIGKTNTDCMKEDYITIIKDGAGVGRTRLLPKGSMFLGTMGAITPRNSNLDFLYQLVSNANLGSLYTGSTIPHIYFKDYGKNTYHVPHIVEQEQIGAFFYNIDHYITFYRYKYDKLQNIKKSMLEKMFPKNGSNIPEIRFAGFTDAWEQRKLCDVLSLLKDGTHGTHKDSDYGPFLLSAKNIKNGQIIIDDLSDRRISQDAFDQIHSTFKLQKDDVLLTIVGSIGETAILENADGLTFQRSVAFLRPNGEMTSRFLRTEIEADRFQKELQDRKSQSAQPGVYLGELEKIPVMFPKIGEQKKIADYFSNLDNLITLHQRKLEKLQNIKKMMLEKMFV